MSQVVPSPLYAAIDLGSNSFHMLVVRHIDGSVQTMAKIKRKVRLAAGLNDSNTLSQEAMQRGWDCLSLFAERLQDIPQENIRIVGTATLRTATNVDVFLAKANQILGYKIDKMGCVTWLERHFKDRQLTTRNFDQAIDAAKATLDPILQQYTELGWDVCVGASGTVQALQEIMLAQGMDEVSRD